MYGHMCIFVTISFSLLFMKYYYFIYISLYILLIYKYQTVREERFIIPSVSVEAYDGAELLTSKLGNTKEEEEPSPFHFQVTALNDLKTSH